MESCTQLQGDRMAMGLLFAASTLLQIYGMLMVTKLLNERTLILFFSGADGSLSKEERLQMRVYRARLVGAIWEHKNFNTLDRMSILITLDYRDLQRLILREDEGKKKKRQDNCHYNGEKKRIPPSSSRHGSLAEAK